MTAVLGIHLGPAHDTGAALVYEQGGELCCVAIAEARLSRIKHSREFPRCAIEACLAELAIEPRELSAIVVEYNSPDPGPRAVRPFVHAKRTWQDAAEVDWFASFTGVPLYEANHHLCHAVTAWHTTRWPEDAEPGAVLVADGRGTLWECDVDDDIPSLCVFPRNPDLESLTDRAPHDRRLERTTRRGETQTIFSAQGRSLKREAVSLRPGVGHFFVWVTQMILDFAHMHSGKTMGLAAFGVPGRTPFPRLTDHVLNGIDTDFLNHIREHAEGGLAFRGRRDEAPTDDYFADASAWVQEEFTRTVVHLARTALNQTGARRLGFAGGAALNIVANRTLRDALREEGILDDLYIHPAASDEGLALGAALLGYYNTLGGTLPFQQNHAYLGPTANTDALTRDLNRAGGVCHDDLAHEIVERLLAGQIIGWANGRSEHGPRALGARSILCWPRPAWMKDHLNARVKHREAFRPFAPLVLAQHAHEAFDLDVPSPYMLLNAHVRASHADRIPAVTHVDGTARLQTLDPSDAPALSRVLARLRERDGVGVVLNTSFNDNNEPIVETAQHAIDCARRTGLDALVCGDAFLEFTPLPASATP